MSDRQIRTSSVKVLHGDLAIDAYLAVPDGAADCAAVIVIQEIFGVNAHIRDVTERFAKAGYVAIAPAIYQRLAPGFEVGYTPEDVQIGRKYKEQTKADELLGDIQAAIDYLKQLPEVTGKIGCIGFCFGGHVAYLAATLPDIAATASFYGAGIPTWCPGDGTPTLNRTKEIRGTLYGFFGMEDASIPPEHVDQIEAELQRHQVPHRVFRYANAEHGFFCDRRNSYNPEAAADAWKQVQALFETTLSSIQPD
jgi:carboxymethylenebutenolidase